MNENLLPTDITIERGNLGREVIRNWDKICRNVDYLMHDNWVVFQDMTPPKSIFRKGTDMPKLIQRVKFAKAIARHTKIRDQNPSVGYTCPGEPHERSPTLRNLRIVHKRRQSGKSKVPAKQRGSWPKIVFKSREHEKEAFFSSPENRCHLASTLKRICCGLRYVNAHDQQKGLE